MKTQGEADYKGAIGEIFSDGIILNGTEEGHIASVVFICKPVTSF